MVGLYQKRNPEYSEKAKIYKKIETEDGSSFYHETYPSNYCYCKDYGFKTVYTNSNGHNEKNKVGKLETLDLKEDEIMPDDIIEYQGTKYIVFSVVFEDDEKAKHKSIRPYGKTTIEVRK